ncbi:glutamate receptor ionotropic, NMDA 2B-like [Glandiceps talaboti]
MEHSGDGNECGHRIILIFLVVGQIILSVFGASSRNDLTKGVETNATWKDTIRLGALVTNPRHEEVILKTLRRWETNSSNVSSLISVELIPVSVNASEHIDIVRTVCNTLLPQGVTTIVAAIDGEYYTDTYIANRLVALVSRYLTAPVISANMRILSGHVYREEDMPFINIGASMVQQCRAMMAFLEYHNWYHFSIVTTTTTPDYREFITVLESLSAEITHDANHNKTWEVCQAFSLDLAMNVTEQYTSIAGHDCQIFLVYASYEEAKELFLYANDYTLLEEGFVWMVTEPVFGNDINVVPEEFPIGVMGVKFFSREYNKEQSVEDSTAVYLSGLQDYIWAKKPFPVVNMENCTESHASKRNNTSMYDFQKYIVSSTLKEKQFRFDNEGFMKDPRMVLLNVDQKRKWKQVGIYVKDKVAVDGVTWLGNTKTKPENLTPHRTIRVTTIFEESFVRSIPTTEGECHVGSKCKLKNNATGEYYYECCVGVCIDILTQLSNDLQFNFELHVVEDNRFGAPHDENNENWDGLIGDILEGRADAAIASMQATQNRAQVVDLSVAFMETGISVMVKKSEGQVPSDAFLAPFDYGVWLFLTLFTVNLVAIVIFMFECLSPGGYDRNIWEPRPSRFTLGSSFWIVWALLFNNTVPLKPPKSYTAKFMTNMWGCFCLIFIAMYTANLVAHLIQEKSHDKISGFNDKKIQYPQSANPQLKYATVKSTNIEQYIKKTNKKMDAHMMNLNKENASEAVDALKTGEIDAFIYGAAMLRHQAAKDKDCDLRVVGETVAHSGYVMALTKGSHWREPINQQILKYIDTGKLL